MPLRKGLCSVAALRTGCLAVGLLAAATSSAAEPGPPSEEALRAVQERGRLIALYQQAVERGAALLKSQGGNAPPSDRTIVIPERAGWRVVFLKDLTGDPAAAPTRKGFAVVAETTFSPDAGQVGTLDLIVPSKMAPSMIQSYARALGEAEASTVGRADGGPPFVEAVVREKDAAFSVYLISRPAEDTARQGEAGSPGGVVLGRDFLVRVAATGRQVLSVDKLHDGSAALSLEPRPAGAPLLHEHDKGDLPAPTDVALVLLNPVMAPLLVVTPRFLFRVDREGRVTWLGANPHPRPAETPAAGAAHAPASTRAPGAARDGAERHEGAVR